jgi:hypothetical protein
MRRVPFTYPCTLVAYPYHNPLVLCPTLMSSASRSKSPSPIKKATPEIVVDKPEATVNVEDVASSGGAEDEKPDTSDVGESSFSFAYTIFPSPSISPPPFNHLSSKHGRVSRSTLLYMSSCLP